MLLPRNSRSGENIVRTIIRLVLAASMLVATCSVGAFADGNDPPPCLPSDPTCHNPKLLQPPTFGEFPTLVQMR